MTVEQDILDYVRQRSEARAQLVEGFTSIVSAREAVRCADVVIEQGWAPRSESIQELEDQLSNEREAAVFWQTKYEQLERDVASVSETHPEGGER